jgi:MSHA biogenesis protein MshG
MPNFLYTGRDGEGKLVKGAMEAATSDIAAGKLIEKGVIPLEINEGKSALRKAKSSEQQSTLSKILNWEVLPKKVKAEDIITFCRQMYTLSKAGVPILDALNQLASSARTTGFKKALLDVVKDISSGLSLEKALAKHKKIFSKLFVSVVAAGENIGQLDMAFSQLAIYLELEQKTKQRIKTALRYPTILIVTLTIALIVVNFMVVPVFADIFTHMNMDLPLPTRILIASSAFFTNYWPYLLIGIILLAVVIYYYLKTATGRYLWDKWKLKIPVFGFIIYRILLGRFARTFSMMVHAGVQLVQSLNLVADVMDNTFLRERILKMRAGIERGDTLIKTATNSELFSSLVLQMMSVGEESGSIDTLLMEVAEFYEGDVDYDLKRLADLIEPFLLIIMGVMVLVLALGVFLPMWDMISSIQA